MGKSLVDIDQSSLLLHLLLSPKWSSTNLGIDFYLQTGVCDTDLVKQLDMYEQNHYHCLGICWGNKVSFGWLGSQT